MIRYDDHAEFQIVRRGLDKTWIESTLSDPDAIEVVGTRRSHLKCFEGRRVMLRVVTPKVDPTYVITAYFDRTRPCA